MYSEKLEDLLKDGYTRKYAQFYLNILEEEKNNSNYDQSFVSWSHSRGFRAEVASIYGINDNNCSDYLTDYDYYRIWPINSWERIWINDKMTLKYILSGTAFDSLMPEYYYYSTPNGLRPLMDNPYKNENNGLSSFCKLLKERGAFACKPCNGSTSVGFFKLSFSSDGNYYIDNTIINEERIKKVIEENPNYVFTEYIHPNPFFSKMNETIHTLRLVTVNENGYSPRIIGGYLRIPHLSDSSANFIHFDSVENYNIVADVNPETGEFGDTKLVYFDRVEDVLIHPDTGVPVSGIIENYEELRDSIIGVAKLFNTIEFMGFDIGVTDKGFKCMEINSHPGIGHMQLFHPFLADSEIGDYFKKKIAYINSLSEIQKNQRINIPR
ncbi:MAG: hypothetical protein IJ746_01745 [Ruminococcus sp.]|nr:hypothetical protein [Ruminococcus sp.]